MPQTASPHGNTFTKPYDIATIFNNYLSLVAETTKYNIKYFLKHFFDYLKHQCNNSIFIQFTYSVEITNIISTLCTNKSSESNGVPYIKPE